MQEVIEMSLAVAETPNVLPSLPAAGKTLETTPSRLGWMTPTAGDTPGKQIRELYLEQGYVWLKRFLDPADVVGFRGYVFRALIESGLLAEGRDPELGISSGGAVRKDVAARRLMSLVRSATYEGFCAQPRIAGFMDEFLGGLSYLHKRKIMRYTQPHTPTATPAHYDLVYLRGGPSRVVTSWLPIGDCPVEMGGLVYLEGSHQIGVEMEREFSRNAGNLTPEEKINAYKKNMTDGGSVC